MTRPMQRGFSLVELMVTIVVALLLLVGIARVFLTSKQSYRVQESTSRMQENIRIASDYFSRYLRLADFWGGVHARDLSVLGTLSYGGRGACKDAWIVNPQGGLIGYTGGTSTPIGLAADCLAGRGYVTGSDAIAVRYANPDRFVTTLQLQGSATDLAVNGKYYLRAKVGQSAVLFDVLDSAQRSTVIASTIPGDVDSGVMNYQFQNVLFYIETNDFGRGPVPTLSMLKTLSNDLRPDQLVDGIEMLAFAYGLDTNDDLQVDSYREAGDITNWSQVLSVRVSFIARGDELDNVVDTAEYAMTASRCYGPSTSSCAMKYSAAAARYQRRLVVQEIQLRNRVRG